MNVKMLTSKFETAQEHQITINLKLTRIVVNFKCSQQAKIKCIL